MTEPRSNSKSMVVARFLARAGVGSRRACEKLIGSGDITINGETITTVTTRVDPETDEVYYRGNRLALQDAVYYLLHKPAGYTCSSHDAHAGKLAIDLLSVDDGVRVYSIGRLDRDSEGLLLFTSDGDMAHALTHPSFEVPRIYSVDVEGTVTPAELARLEAGIVDKGEQLRANSAEIIQTKPNETRLRLALTTGRNREVRRMIAHLRHDVRRLRRTAYGPIELGNFEPGFTRRLTAGEVEALKKCTVP